MTFVNDRGDHLRLSSIAFRRVLDIGVGHVHHHEQYGGVTGAEVQPLRASSLIADLYRLVNGPVRDGDGYIDGTCNFYALVELDHNDPAVPRYALLFQDEQSYFTQRWRMVGLDDTAGLGLALAADLGNPVYAFDPAKYWCPLRAGRIGPRSRLAVAAQVILLSDDGPHPGRIYSTNFSWSTMDRTWRWRDLPGAVRHFDASAVAAGPEPVAPASQDTAYPQSIRLREDMTLHVKGTRGAVPGRWYQRYLPAGNTLVPDAQNLRSNEPPAVGYGHPWKFLPEPLFALADRFSHLGVYAAVDSRMQYYAVDAGGRRGGADTRRGRRGGVGGPGVPDRALGSEGLVLRPPASPHAVEPGPRCPQAAPAVAVQLRDATTRRVAAGTLAGAAGGQAR